MLAIAALAAFAAIAEDVPENGVMVRGDQFISQWIARTSTVTGVDIGQGLSWLGAPVLAIVVVSVVVVLAMRKHWFRAWAVALTCAGSVVLNQTLKFLFHRGRPEQAWKYVTHDTWSFPSGHAMNSLACYGFLAYLLVEATPHRSRKHAIVAATVVLVLLIGASRNYLNVHYVSDVVGGFLAGIAWLFVCIAAYTSTPRRVVATAAAAETDRDRQPR